jgi:hypothetical protein
MDRELLQRDPIRENIDSTPIDFGGSVAYALWVAYAWVTRLQYGVLLSVAILSSISPAWHLDVPDNPAIHAIFPLLFVVSMLTFFLTAFCDPGICATETKDGLKPVCTIPQPFTRRYRAVYVKFFV